MPYFIIYCLLFVVAVPGLLAHESQTSRPDAHAPIGVMGDHLHRRGEWMSSFRTMNMSMEENFQGTEARTVAQARAMGPTGPYMMVPVEMDMSMTMLGLMYAPNDHNTFMVMFNHLDQDMVIEMMNGTRFSTESKGLGDTSLTWMRSLPRHGHLKPHFGLGLHLPTGSIFQRDDTPMSGGNAIVLPYPMQLGSGTWDLEPSFTLNAMNLDQALSWGFQVKGVFRTGNNRQGYRLGDTYEGMAWMGWRWNRVISTSLRLHHKSWGDIDGKDRDLSAGPAMVPTADTSLRGGNRWDLSLGLNLIAPKGHLKGHRLALEWTNALRQDLHGPQLGLESSWTLGWQKAF